MAGEERRRYRGMDWLGLVSFGVFLILLGMVWLATPNMGGEVEDFLMDFRFEDAAGNAVFPAPAHSHPVLYTAAAWFFFIFGAFSCVVLFLRFVYHEPVHRKSETLSGIVFWFGAALSFGMLANATIGWYGLIAGLVISLGLAVIARSLVRLFTRI